jgi:transposase-like protein
MTSKEKQEYAYLLYVKNDGLTQEEIARRVGVHPNTISRWKDKNKWDELRESLLTTRQEQLRRLYMQLSELNDHIMAKPEGERFANKSEADAMIQITRSIANLEKDISLGTIIDVFIPFLDFVSSINPAQAKQIVELQDSYIKSIMK